MIHKNILVITPIFIFFSLQISAQDIKGKKIFISNGSVVTLKFSNEIQERRFNPQAASNLFADYRIFFDKIFLRLAQKITDTITLFIEEGKNKKKVNTHSFILIYKDKLDEVSYDFSDKNVFAKTLEELKAENEKEKLAQPNTVAVKPDASSTTNTSPPPPQEKQEPAITQNTEPEKNTISQHELDSINYKEIRNKAIHFFREGNFDSALVYIKRGLEFKPRDVLFTYQLDSINNYKSGLLLKTKIDEQKRMKDADYLNHIHKGDSALKKGAYDFARIQYNEARKDSATGKEALAGIKKIDSTENEESYETYMDIGKNYLNENEFGKADTAFHEALTIKPNDKEATKYLNDTKIQKENHAKFLDDQKKNAEIESRYRDTINVADDFFEAGLYEKAKPYYEAALKIKRDDAHAKERIVKIDSLLKLQTEKLTQQRTDSITNASYEAAKKRGDAAFASKDYKTALKEYKLAKEIKPAENYPDTQILQIQNIQKSIALAEQQEKARKKSMDSLYNALSKEYKAALFDNNYARAYTVILQLKELKPDDSVLVRKSREISTILAEIEKEKRYETYYQKADSLYIVGDLDGSLKWYDSAIAIKPLEYYPKKQYIYISSEIYKRDSIQQAEEKQNKINNDYNEALTFYKKGDTARMEKRFEEAYEYYDKFLNKIDTANINEYSGGQRVKIYQALEYINKGLANFKPRKSNIQTIEQLKVMYPEIDFTKAPPDQHYNSKMLDYAQQTQYIGKEILSKSSSLSLMNNYTEKIRLACNGIFFTKDHIYFRFSIKNNDTMVFMAGAMLLSVTKNNEITKKLLPVFISDFPVVFSGTEKQIVYVVNETKIIVDRHNTQENETLLFEVTDRLNKIKTSLSVSGVIFNKEQLGNINSY